MLDWRTINYAHWQMRRGQPGAALFGHLDVEQAVQCIALTEKGSVPLEPNKCVRLLPWVDAPEPVARPNIVRELWDGVATYEPRVVLEEILPSRIADSRWLFLINLHLAGDVERKRVTIEVPYGPA